MFGDGKHNNLYSFKSQIASLGQKKFIIEENQYIIINSVQLIEKVITKEVFENIEVYKILNKMMQLISSTKIPDLKYIILNTYEELYRRDFFAK